MEHLSDKEILQKTIDYCVSLGMRKLSIGDIGRVPSQPETSAEIIREDRLPGIITYDIIRLYAIDACSENIMAPINYFRHFGTYRHLEDLREMGHPEYSLEWIVSGARYIEQRRQDICIIAQEEVLRDSLEQMEEKYGRRRVSALKRRLKISPIMHDVIADHYARFRTR